MPIVQVSMIRSSIDHIRIKRTDVDICKASTRTGYSKYRYYNKVSKQLEMVVLVRP